MADITTYTNDLVLDFLDAFHTELKRVLESKLGERWLTDGIHRPVGPKVFERVDKMLNSPMRVVDMGQNDEELYDVDHIRNIVEGNWKGIFDDIFVNRDRTLSCLGEIGEVRVNLRHRRNRHKVFRGDLMRCVQNCLRILYALESPAKDKFAEIEESLLYGGSPWGTQLAGYLPPRDEIYSEFVGRPNELQELSDWFSSDTSQILVWGHGGSGKSALAYRFAREVRDSSAQELEAVCWVSAKKSEFVEGFARDRSADFNDLPSLIGAVWAALYGDDAVPESSEPEGLIDELKSTPILLVVDDFDTVSEDDDLADFLLYEMRGTLTRIIYTSRRRELLGRVWRLEAPAFSDDELKQFVESKAHEHGVDEAACLRRLNAIRSVTDAYPLYVDDLVRHARIGGIGRAINDWQQRKGDAAREYALRRQVEHLGHSNDRILMTLSIADRPLIIPEISEVAGLTDYDVQSGLDDLSNWRLVNQVVQNSPEPAFSMNANTRRLVQQTYKSNNRLNGYRASFRALTGERVPEAKKKAVALTIKEAMEIERRQGIEPAARYLIEKMTGELADVPDLYGVLGRIYSKRLVKHSDQARDAFRAAYDLGASKSDSYYHWFEMEKRIAEDLVSDNIAGEIQIADVISQWERCEQVAELGIRRCGESRELCFRAGYAASRQGKSRDSAGQFIVAQSDYGRAKARFYQALEAPTSDVGELVRDGMIYRGLTITLSQLQSESQDDELAKVLSSWKSIPEQAHYFQNEVSHLYRNHPALMSRIAQRFPSLRLTDVFA